MMADTVAVSRQLLAAIRDFVDAYQNDTRFRDVIASLRDAEGGVERLVPAARDDADRESPGRRSAREAAEEAAERGDGARGYGGARAPEAPRS